MDRQYIDDRHIVARYLADQLPDAEREAFEAYYLQHPELMQELEAAARFKLGLMQLRDSGQLGALVATRSWFRQPRYLAAAAAVAALVIASWLLFETRGRVTQPLLAATSAALIDRSGAPLPLAGTHSILRTRGITYDAQIQLPASPQAIELRVLPEDEVLAQRYRIELSSVSDDGKLHTVAQIGALRPAADGFVPVYLSSAQWPPGRYRLVLTAEGAAAAAASTFTLRVRPAAAR